MMRHKKNKHGSKEQRANTVSDSELTDSELTDSDTDHSMSGADEASVGERPTDVDREDPWDSVIQKAFEKCQDQFERRVKELLHTTEITENDARQRAYLDMRAIYRKAASGIFTDRMLWFHAIRKQWVYKAIKKTVNNFVELDDYGLDEAWKSAVGQRKYLFDTILADYNPPDLEDDEEEQEETNDEGPSAKKARA